MVPGRSAVSRSGRSPSASSTSASSPLHGVGTVRGCARQTPPCPYHIYQAPRVTRLLQAVHMTLRILLRGARACLSQLMEIIHIISYLSRTVKVKFAAGNGHTLVNVRVLWLTNGVSHKQAIITRPLALLPLTAFQQTFPSANWSHWTLTSATCFETETK
jgi:hypothetical protein